MIVSSSCYILYKGVGLLPFLLEIEEMTKYMRNNDTNIPDNTYQIIDLKLENGTKIKQARVIKTDSQNFQVLL